ncbi:MAG: flagellar basal body P-ring protein FlgI [Comamonadaceae bacterium]
MKTLKKLSRGCVLVLALVATTHAFADRVKDIASVAAVRSNQLIGYGLVVGLQGTGDGADVSFTAQSMKGLLGKLGVALDGPLSDFETAATSGKIDIANVAAVMVTAELPGFTKPGQKIDINVAAIGKANSLRGGNLLMTSLRGVDGQVYALAQGPVGVTGVEQSAAGSQVNYGVPTSLRIPNGAQVERVVENPFDQSDFVVFNLREADFTTATAIVEAVNATFGEGVANAIDGMSLSVRSPKNPNQRVAFMSMIENLDVTPGVPPARVVVNARTGTVVISRNVKVSASAVTHGTMTVSVSATNEVSQPAAFGGGQTAAVANATVGMEEPNKPMFLFQPGVDLREIVDAINQVGAPPSSLIAILEALKSAGSLRAELVII